MKRMMGWFLGGLVSFLLFFVLATILINVVLIKWIPGNISFNGNLWNTLPVEYQFAAKGVLLIIFSPIHFDLCKPIGCEDVLFHLSWIAVFCSICFWGWLSVFLKDKLSQRFVSIHFFPKYAISILLTSLVMLVNAWVLVYIDDGGNLFNDRVSTGRYEYLPVGKFLSEMKLLP